MILFRKSYTRDTSLILQQLWFEAIAELPKILNISPHPCLFGVDYVNNGPVEVWQNVDALHSLRKELALKSNTNPTFFINYLKGYAHNHNLKAPSSINDFSRYLKKICQLMPGDVLLSWLAVIENVHPDVKDLAVQLRSDDNFFSDNDTIIREYIYNFFPKYVKYVTCLRYQDFPTLPSIKECAERFQNFIVASDGYVAIQSLVSYGRENNFVFETPLLQEVKGIVAYPGMALGRVCYIKMLHDLNQLKNGEILITSMTTPNFLPAAHKAAAIITDEGGLLCHAAVIARELKIPCIIGTRVATQLLKDGDLVEVDANKGIVKIIKRK